MLVVLDIGNTHTVVGLYKGEQLIEHWRLETHQGRTSDEMGILLRQLFAASNLNIASTTGAIVACVMPTVLNTTCEMLSRYFNVEPVIVGPGIRTQMPILYENPREVGADRIVNAVAAYQRYQCGLVVVDFGTGVTFDAVSPRGEYLGGVIAPGIEISTEALFQQASKLPRVELNPPDRVVGRNTVTSMQSGFYYGYVGMVEEIARRMRQELSRGNNGFDAKCIATGALAAQIAQDARCIESVHPHLTLEGLRILYERNTSR